MKTLLILLVFVAVSVFGQIPAPSPMPLVPCTAVVDVVIGSQGLILRTCDQMGAFAAPYFFGNFKPGFVAAVDRLSDGTVVVLKDDGGVVKSTAAVTQEWETPRAMAIVAMTGDTVTTVRENSQTPTEHRLYSDGGVYSRKLWEDKTFPVPCTQLFQVKDDKYCLDRNNARIYRATAGFLSPAQARNATPYLELKGLVFARPYRDGFLLLVTAELECPEPAKIPDAAVFCYLAGQCKEVAPSRLLYVSGDKPNARVVTTGMKVVYSSSFVVSDDVVYVVESQWEKDGEWNGDFVSKLDLKTGKKTSYLSQKELSGMYGVQTPSLWIN